MNKLETQVPTSIVVIHNKIMFIYCFYYFQSKNKTQHQMKELTIKSEFSTNKFQVVIKSSRRTVHNNKQEDARRGRPKTAICRTMYIVHLDLDDKRTRVIRSSLCHRYRCIQTTKRGTDYSQRNYLWCKDWAWRGAIKFKFLLQMFEIFTR